LAGNRYASFYTTIHSINRPATLGGGQWNLSNLTGITIVFGKNGSGKSLLLRGWRDANAASCHYVVPERGGDLGYEAGYLAQQLDAKQRRDNSTRNFVEQYRRQVISRIQSYFATRGDVRAGQLPGDPAEIESALSQLLPDFSLAISAVRNPPYRITRTSNNVDVGDIEQLSSGEAQLMTIAIDILTIAAIWDIQNTTTRIILVDEPDAHIHPDLQVRFADFIIRIAARYKLQVVIATHSTTLLAAVGQFGSTAASVIYLDRANTDFVATPFTAVLKELAACLGGHALMGPLFGIPILLVEGDDDYRIWSQVPRHHVVSFAVIPTHGEEIKQYQKTLERVFAALREKKNAPAGFALIDGDKGIPQANEKAPQDHIRFIQLQCHEAENLYLTDEVLASLGINWQQAAAKIVAAAPNHGAKQALLQSATTWNRHEVDIKTIIEEIALALDEKRVHWTIRVARAIGSSRPQGQIATFLGDHVIEALWGRAPS
jgi:predicted ATPase